MSQNRRARVEQRKKQESLARKLKVGVAGVALAAAGVTAYSVAGHEKPTVSAMPSEVTKLIDDVGKQTSSNLDPLKQASYKELASRQIGSVRVRIAEVGGAQGTDYNKILDTYQALSTYMAANPIGATHEVTTIDAQNRVMGKVALETTLKPVGKNITVLSVPASLNIGSYQGEGPDVFTSVEGAEAVSFIRPDLPDANEGMITEACQGMVEVGLLNPSLINSEKEHKLTLLLQEQFCNTLAKALYARQSGETYADYSSREISASRPMFTDKQVAEGDTGYVSKMPYIASESVYNELNPAIPPIVATSFLFPALETQ